MKTNRSFVYIHGIPASNFNRPNIPEITTENRQKMHKTFHVFVVTKDFFSNKGGSYKINGISLKAVREILI